MNNTLLVKFKSFVFRYKFLESLIVNLIYVTWHYFSIPIYYIYYFSKKPYIGGYYCSDQHRFRQVYKKLEKSLKYLIENYYYTDRKEIINVLEIGTCAGGSALQICKFFKKNNINNFKIYCVDHWKKFTANRQEKRWNFHEYILNHGLENGKIFKIFKDNMKFSGFEKNVEIIVGSSEEALVKVNNVKFDFIYIDGGHSYQVVSSDIKKSIPLLKERSLICGDDYEVVYEDCDKKKIKEDILDSKQEFCLEHKSKKLYHPGVTMAVADFFGNIPSHEGFWIQKRINKQFEDIEI